MRAALATVSVVSVVSVAAVPNAASAASADVLVVGRSGLLREAGPVTLKRARLRVGGRRCTVAAATPLAALARTSLKLRLRDYGACGRRPADAGGLYVRGIGRQVERGRDGWVYKIGRRTPPTGAGDPASRLRAGARVLWFWCRSAAKGCQRTLEVRPDARTAAAGSALRVTVTAYDDGGHGVAAAGATVALGAASARTGADGAATLTVPAGADRQRLTATRSGLVPAFPVEVAVT